MAPQFEMGIHSEMRRSEGLSSYSETVEDFIPWRAFGALIVLGGFILFLAILGLSIYTVIKYLNRERDRMGAASAAGLDSALIERVRSQGNRGVHRGARIEDVEMQDIHLVCCDSCSTEIINTDKEPVIPQGR